MGELVQGVQGPQGVPGPTGPQGPAGAEGIPGTPEDGSLLPIAFAHVLANGTLNNSKNVGGAVWNAGAKFFELTLLGPSGPIDYFYLDFLTVVTPDGSHTASAGSVGGHLVIELLDGNGMPVQASFQFVTFRSP